MSHICFTSSSGSGSSPPNNKWAPAAESTPLSTSKQTSSKDFLIKETPIREMGSSSRVAETATAATSEKFWYKPNISRDLAVSILKNSKPGDFIVRDSKSFQGSYGLCVRVERHQVILDQSRASQVHSDCII